MTSLHPAATAVICIVAVSIGLYILFIGLAIFPFFQRHFLYAHRISNIHFINLNKPEKWGFAQNQVTPFGLVTPDNETLYAWHILPLPLSQENEAVLAKQQLGYCNKFETTESFRLLKEDPHSRLVLYFHGNAGHAAQGIRPTSYHALTDTSSYHVIAIDYRGFGHSTGAPTEMGLIEDSTALVEWAINVAGVPPERIVLLGHSLGTAVVSAIAERYILHGTEFAGLVLVGGFSDLATMLSEYRMGGIIPVLAPFRFIPPLLRQLRRRVIDKWQSAQRITNLVHSTNKRLRLNLVHAINDRDIPWTEDNKLFQAAVKGGTDIPEEEFPSWKGERTIEKGGGAFVTTWKDTSRDIIVRQEVFPYGGHNPIMGYAPVALAVMRCFDFEGTAVS